MLAHEGNYDLAVVGAGIIGLAHAYVAAKRGARVAVFERSGQAEGASIRNFGLIWPIGQRAEHYGLALRSRQLWLELLKDAGLYHAQTGSLHLTYREDEGAVAREFAQIGPDAGYDCAWLDKEAVLKQTNAVNEEGLMGALWSPTEVMVDPRQVMAALPHYLSKNLGIAFHFNTTIDTIDGTKLTVGTKYYNATQTLVCCGSVLNQLFPNELGALGLNLCKLQMLKTNPQGQAWQLGPALAGGLTLRFYQSFQICRTLEALRTRIASETPELDHWGIHTMVSQSADGSLVFGDSHEYGPNPSPFLRADIDNLILNHIGTYLRAPNTQIAERWSGVYAKHPSAPYCRLPLGERVSAVTGFGGAGMTLSFGAAEQTIDRLL